MGENLYIITYWAGPRTHLTPIPIRTSRNCRGLENKDFHVARIIKKYGEGSLISIEEYSFLNRRDYNAR